MHPLPLRDTLLYASGYCEENIWHLCDHPSLRSLPRQVALISGSRDCCGFWAQRPPLSSNGVQDDGATHPVFWDYHVILLVQHQAGWMVWDLDTALPLPIDLSTYLEQTFPPIPTVWQHLRPLFRLLEASIYRASFHSDRAHMVWDGVWLQPPPPWPPILPPDGRSFLPWTEMAADDPNVLTLPALRSYFSP